MNNEAQARQGQVASSPRSEPEHQHTETFVLENANGIRMKMSERGAGVMSLCTPDKYGKLADIVLGYDDPAEYLDDEFYLGTVVGRFANRIAGEYVSIGGKRFRLSTTGKGFHHHGGVNGFNKKIFKGTAFSGQNFSGVTFTYCSAHMEEGFPGELRLDVSYTLSDNNEWIVEYRATTDRDTIINLTQHSYFNLSGDLSTTIDDHLFTIYAGNYLPVNNLHVPTGAIAAVAGTPFDFTSPRKPETEKWLSDPQVGQSNGYDHSFVLQAQHTSELKPAATVTEPISGRRLDVSTTEPAVHFYAGNFLDQVKGKQGIYYSARTGFCLETQHFPDAPNHPHFPSTELKAGEQFYSKTIFRFSV